MRDRAVVAVLLSGVCLVLSIACSDEKTDTDSTDTQAPTDGATTKPTDPAGVTTLLLKETANNVILGTYKEFSTSAKALEDACTTYKKSTTPDNLAKAQEAWKAAIALWQRAEVMQVGPAGAMGDVIGGNDIRDEIYSWTLVNNCRVDQELYAGTYKDTEELKAAAVNVRGLDALEYLLFRPDDGNACKDTSSLNLKGQWDEIKANLTQLRADYALAAAGLVSASAQSLLDAWTPGSGQYVDELSNAGNGSEKYTSTQAALNSLSDALFYIDKMTKDMKLAQPVGIAGCDTDLCPDKLESKWARVSKEHIISNLIGAQLIFHGGDTPEESTGFDDLLISMSAEELAISVTVALKDALEAINAVEGTLADALASSPTAVENAHQKTKEFTDLLKTQFLAVLNLEANK